VEELQKTLAELKLKLKLSQGTKQRSAHLKLSSSTTDSNPGGERSSGRGTDTKDEKQS